MKRRFPGRPDKDEWETPPGLFQAYHERFNFTLDAAASHSNHLLPHYCTADGEWLRGEEREYLSGQDGLTISWRGERVWCNPPYSDIEPWVAKADREARENKAVCVMLLPASVEVRWFHRYIYGQWEVEFPKSRVKYLQNGQRVGTPQWPSMVVLFGVLDCHLLMHRDFPPEHRHRSEYARLWRESLSALSVLAEDEQERVPGVVPRCPGCFAEAGKWRDGVVECPVCGLTYEAETGIAPSSWQKAPA